MFDQLRRVALLGPSSDINRTEVLQSAHAIENLKDVSIGSLVPTSDIAKHLAPCLLAAADSDYVSAQMQVISIINSNSDEYLNENENFIDLCHALLVSRRPDLLEAALNDNLSPSFGLSIDFVENSPHPHAIEWRIDGKSFKFLIDIYATEITRSRLLMLSLIWVFPLFEYFSAHGSNSNGAIYLSLYDVGLVPGLAFCDSRPQYLLIPDNVFIPTRGYEYAQAKIEASMPSWSQRRDCAFWRGNTTGRPLFQGNWETLPRVALCSYTGKWAHTKLFDVALSGLAQIDSEQVAADIMARGYIGGQVPWWDWAQCKYQIDIDGNTNAWSGLFYRLLSGSAVLKVTSHQGFMQWYYDRLLPWINYVPVASDFSDLVDKVQWLRKHDGCAERIGQAGRELALSLSYEREMRRAVNVVDYAIEACGPNGSQHSHPFGWHL